MTGARPLIVTPARYESARLPGKVLLDIHGKPMVVWVASRVIASGYGDVIVATDSDRVQAVCAEYDLPVIMTSPNCANGTERVREVAQRYQEVDYFMNVQGDEPLINTDILGEMLAQNVSADAFYTAVSAIEGDGGNPSEVKVAMSFDGRIRFASRSPVPFFRDSERKRYKIHGIYLYSRDVLERFVTSKPGPLEQAELVEQLRCIEHDIPLYGVVTSHTERSVDTSADLDFMRAQPKSKFVTPGQASV